MRKWILHIHLYSLLFCSSYLIIIGVNSLYFNHRTAFTQPGGEKVNWERSIVVDNIENNRVFSAAVRDSLGLIGWTIPWQTYRDSTNNLHFGLNRPGKRYKIHVLTEQNLVKVEEEKLGYWHVICSMHPLMRLPSAPFISFWGFYNELGTLSVLFCVISGIYLWATRGTERLIGFILLASASISSLALMAYVWLKG